MLPRIRSRQRGTALLAIVFALVPLSASPLAVVGLPWPPQSPAIEPEPAVVVQFYRLVRPFASPATSRTVTVPSSIDATGSSDVTSALASFVEGVPDGSVIVFPANGTYRVTQGIYLRGRSDLVFEGNGSTIRSSGSGGSTASSGFKLDNLNTDIAIRNFKIVGSNPNTTTLFKKGTESQMGVAIYDGARIEIDNVDVRHVYGDGVFVAGRQASPYRSSDQIWIHDSSFDYIGRHGLVFNAATNSIAERNTYNRIGMFVFDVESDYDYEVVDNVRFRNNRVGTYGLTPDYTNWFFACSGNQGVAVARNIYITGNSVTDGAPINSPNNTSAKGGLATYVGRGNRLSNFVFTGNTTTKAGVGPVLYFDKVDGLTITGNTQPLTSGTLASITSSTGVTYAP